MASITLDKMQKLGVDEFCSQICSIQNRTYSDGKELKYLLPIKYIINEYSLRDSISWKNPITELLLTIPYTNEESKDSSSVATYTLWLVKNYVRKIYVLWKDVMILIG